MNMLQTLVALCYARLLSFNLMETFQSVGSSSPRSEVIKLGD